MAVREDVREKIIQTIPVKRLGKAEEIGSICVWLIQRRRGIYHRRRVFVQRWIAHGMRR